MSKWYIKINDPDDAENVYYVSRDSETFKGIHRASDPIGATTFATKKGAENVIRRLEDICRTDKLYDVTFSVGQFTENRTDEPPQSDEKKPSEEKHGKWYVEGWGEPRGQFRIGKIVYNLYMTKDDKGATVYGYAENTLFEAVDADGAAVVTAMCKAAMEKAVGLIREHERRRKDG